MALLTNLLRPLVTSRTAAPRSARARLTGRATTVAGWAVLVAVVVLMWPSALGGSSTIVRVAGDSMVPTYETRDLLLARHHDGYAVGDVVVFDIPDGVGAGMRVVHRITRISETFEGTTYTTQGDNRADEDQWAVTDADVLGEVVYHLSGSGKVMAKLSDPAAIAIIGGVIIVLLLLPNRRSRTDETPECSQECPDGCPGTTEETTPAAPVVDTAADGPTVDLSQGSADGSFDYSVRPDESPAPSNRGR